jgi:protein-disulfide isomerase
VPDEKLTKNDRRDAAREAARVAREKAKKKERLRRWLIPTSVTVGVLAIAAIVTLVVVTSAPPPQTAAGPKNMASDGIVLVGEDDAMVAVKTPAIPASGTPTPTDPDSVTPPRIVTYVDFSCPACQAFELANSEMIQSLVSAGEASLEVHPIAILDNNWAGSRYSSRSNNVGACVANFAPDSFYDVMMAMYENQPKEGTTGLTNKQIIEVVKGAGLDDADVNKCIDGETFKEWVTAATNRATSGPLPNSSVQAVTGTPTILVDGFQYKGSITDANALAAFIANPS